MAWQEAQTGICPDCRKPLADTLGEDNENRWRVTLHTCDACRARDHAMGSYVNDGGDQRGVKTALHDKDAEG